MPPTIKIYPGQRFNKLIAINESGRTKQGHRMWKCKCDCGKITYARSSHLKHGQVKSCGCLKKSRDGLELKGKKYGRITLISPIKKDKWGALVWKGLCDCGKSVNVMGSSVKSEHTISCGCYNHEMLLKRITTHNKSKTPGYHSWKNAIAACHHPNHLRYLKNKRNNITVCSRWRNSVINFLKDMGEKPGDDYWLGRLNNKNGFNPENCIWKKVASTNKIKMKAKVKKALETKKQSLRRRKPVKVLSNGTQNSSD